MNLETRYTCCVNNGALSDYFEGHYADYIKANGRITLTAFAEKFKFTRSYLSNLMEGKNKSMTYHTAFFVAVVLNDFTILDILGYKKPDTQTLAAFMLLSPNVRQALSEAFLSISESGTKFDSPESVALIVSKLNESGAKVSKIETEPSEK